MYPGGSVEDGWSGLDTVTMTTSQARSLLVDCAVVFGPFLRRGDTSYIVRVAYRSYIIYTFFFRGDDVRKCGGIE